MAKKKPENKTNNERKRMSAIMDRLEEIYPTAHIQLHFKNHFELLVATILSAQCTDDRVNIVTKSLFKKYKKPEDYVKAESEELEKDIFSTGFYKAKAKNIKGMAKSIITDFGGKVPDNMEDLLKLPGVGRKTANVILGHCFGKPAIVVDTHVIRLSNRMGFVSTINADQIEFALMELVDESKWVVFTHFFIYHGRAVCKGRKPLCDDCVLYDICPKTGVF